MSGPDGDDVEREAIQAEGKGQREPRKRSGAPLRIAGEPEPDQRPVIRLVVGELHDAVEHGIRALKVDTNLYQREGALVHVTRATADDEIATDREWREGTPQIHNMAVDTLRERLTRAARWAKFDGRSKGWRPTDPPDHAVKAIASRKEWTGIRRLMGVIETPSLRPDGSVISTPGYDAATGFLYAPRAEFPTIPEQPTLEDAQRALAMLEDVFIDFPYASPACRAMAVAAVLTLIARPAIRGATPAHVFDANTPGSGKTLQADSASLVATGREAGRKNFPTDRRGFDDEVNKMICGYALMGARVINFDNLSPEIAFGGSSLEMVITTEQNADFRLLGTNRVIQLPWRTVIFGSGNNIVLARDMLRRAMVSRIESPYERPELRPISDFKHPDRAFGLKRWIRENRIPLVVAALTLLRAHAVAGRPGHGRTWASFEAWSSVVADAIVWAGGADPLDCRPSEDGEDNPERRSIGVVMRAWSRLDPSGAGITIKTAIAALYPTERLRGENLPPDGFDDVREALEQLAPTKPRQAPDALAVGHVLRRYKRSVVGGMRFDHARTDRNGIVRWVVIGPQRAVEQAPSLGAPTDV